MNSFFTTVLVSLALAGCLTGVTWFETRAHYLHQYDELVHQYEAKSQAAQAIAKAQLDRQTQITEQINHDAQVQLAGASATIRNLSDRLRQQPSLGHITVSAATSPTSCPALTVGPGPAAGTDQPAAAAQPVVTLDEVTLAQVLDTAIDAVTAELLWRKWSQEITQ